MNKRSLLAAVAAVAVMTVMAHPAFAAGSASSAGDNFLTTLQDLITGRLGLFIGLAITVLGLWTWIIKQETGAGITMIVGGVLITVAPGLFNGVHDFVDSAVTGISGGNNTTVQDTAGSYGP